MTIKDEVLPAALAKVEAGGMRAALEEIRQLADDYAPLVNPASATFETLTWISKITKAALASPAPAGGEVLREAVAGLLPWLEDAETKCLVGDEGCVWAVEQLRHALDAATPPPSPDVAGVVERLRAAAGLLPFSDLKSDLTLAERAMLLSAATLLESLSAEKGGWKLRHACDRCLMLRRTARRSCCR